MQATTSTRRGRTTCRRRSPRGEIGRSRGTAVKVLQAYVSQLRRLLGSEAIATGPSGYALSVGPGELDLHRFERLVSAAAGADPAAAASRLRQALALWRGPPLVDFA